MYGEPPCKLQVNLCHSLCGWDCIVPICSPNLVGTNVAVLKKSTCERWTDRQSILIKYCFTRNLENGSKRLKGKLSNSNWPNFNWTSEIRRQMYETCPAPNLLEMSSIVLYKILMTLPAKNIKPYFVEKFNLNGLLRTKYSHQNGHGKNAPNTILTQWCDCSIF